eukprot:349855-Chlamydomonas_euryale.AAC.5
MLMVAGVEPLGRVWGNRGAFGAIGAGVEPLRRVRSRWGGCGVPACGRGAWPPATCTLAGCMPRLGWGDGRWDKSCGSVVPLSTDLEGERGLTKSLESHKQSYKKSQVSQTRLKTG